MKVRITFRSEICIEGKTMEDIAKTWNKSKLFNEDVQKFSPEVIELTSAENSETFEDLKEKFNDAY